MTDENFWSIIDSAYSSHRHSDEQVLETLRRLLAQLPTDALESFVKTLTRLLAASYSSELWGAAYLIGGGCSDDRFKYFRGWLIMQGRRVYEDALLEPDSLAKVVQGPGAELEKFFSIVHGAYRLATGNDLEGLGEERPDLGAGWDFDDRIEMKRRYPRLWERFGW